MKHIALIGSTGSIGTQVCNVVRRYPERFQLDALVANASAEAFLAQVREFHPRYAVLVEERAAEQIRSRIPQGVEFHAGAEAAVDAVRLAEADTAFVAATGFAGLRYSLAAIEGKKRLALANKETLVCGGEYVMSCVERAGVDLVPVDSEHSALWQALHFNARGDYRKLIITASGGPFYSYTEEQLRSVTVKDALKHPTWHMGAKITIDSATLLNKGFEVIEAKWLYGAKPEQIETVVQPESIIHSMVEFADGGILAQLSYPTMELPIQLALTYPERLNCNLSSIDFAALGAIHFKPLERKKFPCFDLALTALAEGDNYPCALNGAGEVAVHAFLRGEIPFVRISEVIARALDQTKRQRITEYSVLCETDKLARLAAKRAIEVL